MSDVQVFPSVCPLDCPDTCALQAGFQDGRLVQIRGADHPITQGFACVKMTKYPQRQEDPNRLLKPQRRVGPKGSGQFAEISWDEALDSIVQRLEANIRQHGEQSVLPYNYAGTMGLIERDHPLAFFRALGASELDWTICAATGGAAWEANYGPHKMSTPPEQLVHSRLILLWGINVLRSNSHLTPWLKAARHQGARILHIDPYRNETSRFADEHWQIAVGTDAALALALGGEILRLGGQDQDYLDRYAAGLAEYTEACRQWPVGRAAEACQLPAEDIASLAQAMANEPATFIKLGYGMTRNEGGGNAARAVSLLPALLGSWQHAGGGGALSTSGAFTLNMSRYSGLHLRQSDRRHVNQNQLGQALNRSEDPISTLFVFNSNPAVVAPDSLAVRTGLSREDLFTVVLEHVQTDTADYADILLPATTFVEHPDLYAAYGHYYLQWADPIVRPRGQCRPNSWVFQELASRMGLDDDILQMSTEELASELLSSDHPHVAGITLERLKRERSVRLNLPEDFRPYSTGSSFEDGKIRFSPPPEQLSFEVRPSAEYPLRLISPPGSYVLNTSLGDLESLLKAAGGEPCVLVHPQDAEQFLVEHEQHIQLSSAQGSIVRKALVSKDTRPGVVVALGQWWAKLAPDGKGLNELTSQDLTDLGGGSLFGNAVVHIQPVDAESEAAV